MRFGDICKFQSGGTPSKNESAYYNGNIPWITTVALNGDFITDSDAVDWITEKAIKESAAKIVPENSIMVGTRVGVGKVGINKIPMSTSQDIISLLGINECEWYKPYLCKCLQSKSAYLNSQARGATIKGIKIDVLASLEISELSIEEQKNISFLFDTLTSLISLRKQQLAKLDELVKARFVELFGDVALNPNGYPVKDFDEISVLITDGEHATPRRTEEGIYLLSARNVLNHTLQLDDVDYIDEEEYNRIARRVIPQAGDVLISCSGSIGRCCVVPDGLKFQMVRSAALIRFDDTINPIFAEWLITSDDLQRQIAQSATQSSQANLFQGKIRKLHGYVPPMKLQNQFAAFVEQTDKSKSAIQQNLDKLETLKGALMQKYFG